MIRRLVAFTLLGWVLGLVVFIVTLPTPGNDRTTDAIVVLTGGKGRIERGLAMLMRGRAQRMLVSGVGYGVTKAELVDLYKADPRAFACCIDLGREAIDTRSNADETARWVAQHKFSSIRLVTTDWHMPRARFELEQRLPPRTKIISDAVDSAPGLWVLIIEYHKWIVRRTAALFGF